jgi:hypothetical protein
MTIATGQPILPADLDTIWDPVRQVQATVGDMYEMGVATLTFDKMNSSLVDPVRYWIPPTDAQIVAVTAVSYSPTHTGNAKVQLGGNVIYNGEIFTIPIISGSTVAGPLIQNELVLGPDTPGQFGVLAGDIVSFTATSVTYSGVGPSILRIQIIYKHRWSRT